MILKKTKYMVITKAPILQVRLTVANTSIEKVMSYKYLGKRLEQSDDQSKTEATEELARLSFMKMRKFFATETLVCICGRGFCAAHIFHPKLWNRSLDYEAITFEENRGI